MDHLHGQGIGGVFNYVPLHSSPVTYSASARLVRLPFYDTITEEEQAEVIRQIGTFSRCATHVVARE
jgi:dTDP-4-amino-4,6-dideoxygalactose transaminase